MIIQEHLTDLHLIKTYSDADMMIRQLLSGDLYDEAIDPDTSTVTYEETDIPIKHDDPDDPPTIEDKAEGYDILIGDAE